MADKEWLTTAETAKALGCSPRHLRNLIKEGKIWAKRDGKNWLIHASLKEKPPYEENPTESQEKPFGNPTATGIDHERLLRTFEEQLDFLKEQLQEKDKHIHELVSQNEKLLTLMAMEKSEKKAIAETAQSLEMEISRYKQPWWGRMLTGWTWRRHSLGNGRPNFTHLK